MSKKRQSRKSPRQRSASRVTAETGRFSEKEFNPDYSQTVKDLKRIAILASSFFVVLVALAFFLR